MVPERSNWIGLVCWGLIIDGMYGIYTTMKGLGADAAKHNVTAFPVAAHVGYAIVFGGYTIMVVCGACMYERQGWARYVYLVGVLPLIVLRWGMLAVAHEGVLAHPAAAPHHEWGKYLLAFQMFLYLLSAYILFMRRARRYYHPPLYVDE